MEAIVVMLVGLLLLDVAAIRWGVSSVEPFNSEEWNRRKSWLGFARR